MEQKVAVIGVVRETECGKINLRVSNCNRETADAISRDWLAGCFISFEKKGWDICLSSCFLCAEIAARLIRYCSKPFLACSWLI